MNDNTVTRQVPTANGTITIRVGDILEGVEGDVTTRIQITYLSKEVLLAKHLWSRRSNGDEIHGMRGEANWTLWCREWKHVLDEKQKEVNARSEVMAKYTFAEVDAVAKKLAEADIAYRHGMLKREPDYGREFEHYRNMAYIALAARDDLFEVVKEQWEVAGTDAVFTASCGAQESARKRRADGAEAKVLHVTRKRKKMR